MAELTVHIPDGLDETQKAELAEWLSKQAAEAAFKRRDFEDAPSFRAEALTKIKRGRDEIEAGQGMDARQSMREIAEEFGIDLQR